MNKNDFSDLITTPVTKSNFVPSTVSSKPKADFSDLIDSSSALTKPDVLKDAIEISKESSQGYNVLADMMGFGEQFGKGFGAGTMQLGKTVGDVGQAVFDSQSHGPVPEVLPGPVDEYINNAFNKYAPNWVKSGFYNKLWKDQAYAETVSKTWEDLSKKLIDPEVQKLKLHEAPFTKLGMIVGQSMPLMLAAAGATIVTGGAAAPEIIVSNVGPAIFGTQAFGENYSQAKEKGLDTDEALAYGVLGGAWSMVTEKIPFDAMLGAKGKPLLKRLATGGGTEAGQELIQTVGQNILNISQGDEATYQNLFNGWMDALVGGAFAGFVGGGLIKEAGQEPTVEPVQPKPKLDISGYDSQIDSLISSIKAQGNPTISNEKADTFGTLMKGFFRNMPKDLSGERFVKSFSMAGEPAKGKTVSLNQGEKVLSTDKGEPITFYHGTAASENFKEFKPQGSSLQPEAIYFSESPSLANIASTGFKSASDTRRARVAPVHIKAEKVFDYRNFDEPSLRKFLNTRMEDKIQGIDLDSVVDSTLEQVRKGTYAAIESPVIQEWIQQEGYDAFRMQEGGSETIGVYKPEQVVPKFDSKGIGLYQGSKGRIDFTENGEAIFNLFKSADMSTLLHEGTHLFSMFMSDEHIANTAKFAGVSEKDLMQFINDPFKTTPNQRANAELALEKLADAAEKYFRNGKAPSSALQQMFDKFREWMVSIYKTIKGTKLDIQIPAEIEKMFSDWFVGDMERRNDFGEIWNNVTGAKFPIYNRKGGRMVPVTDAKNNFTGWLGVENLIKGEPPTDSQLRMLGKGVEWKSPTDLMVPTSENPEIAIEQQLSDLQKLTAVEINQLGKKHGVDFTGYTDRADKLFILESALREKQLLTLPDQPLFGHEKMSAMLNSVVAPDKSNILFKLGANAIRQGAKYFSYWTDQMSDVVGAAGGEYGKQLAEKARQHSAKVHELYGHFVDDAEGFFKAVSPNRLTKVGRQEAKELQDLLTPVRDGKSETSKFRLALDGEDVELTDYQSKIVGTYNKVYMQLGKLSETGKVGGQQVLKGGIKAWDDNLETVNLKTGKKVKGGYVPFKAAKFGGMNRFSTADFQDILTSSDPALRHLVAQELGRLNKLDPSVTKATAKAMKKLNQAGKAFRDKRNGMEFLRTFKVIPDSMEIVIDGKPKTIRLLNSDPYDSMMKMLHTGLSRLAFVDQFNEFDESSKLYNNEIDVSKQIQEAYEKAAPHEGYRSENLLRAMQGMQVFPNENIRVGTIGHGIDNVMRSAVTLFKGLKLPWAFLYNLPETAALAQGIFGKDRVIEGWKTYFSGEKNDAIRLASRRGGRALLASKNYTNPMTRWQDASRMFAGAMMKPLRNMSEINEIVTSLAATEMILDLRGRINLETGQVERRPTATDRATLELLRFTPTQIEQMLAGKASDELYNQIITRGTPRAQATNRMGGENTTLSQSKIWKRLIQFDSYPANFIENQLKMLSMVVNKVPGSGKLLARTMFGATVSGAISNMLSGLVYGGFEDWKEEKKRLSSPLGVAEFLRDAYLANLGGPLVGFIRAMHNSGQATAMNTLRGVSPYTSFIFDIKDAVAGTGRYKNMEWNERGLTWMQNSTPLSKTAHMMMASASIGGRDAGRDEAIKRYWKWYKQADIPRTVGGGSKINEEAEDKQFFMVMSKVKRQMELTGPGEKTAKLLREGFKIDQFDERRVVEALERRKYLDLDVYGVSHKPNMTPERLKELKASMTAEHFQELKTYDQMITLLQERLKREY